MHAVPVEHQDKPTKPMSPKSLPVRPGEDPWTKAELNEVKQALTEDIARFQSQIEISTAELVGLLRDGSEGAGRDPADVGSANFERDAEMSLANNAREMLEQSRLALRTSSSARTAAATTAGSRSARAGCRHSLAPPCV